MDDKTDARKIMDIGYMAANQRAEAVYEAIMQPIQEIIMSRFELENLPVTTNRGFDMTPEYVLAMQIALDHIGILMLEARIKGEFEVRRILREREKAL